MHQYFIANWKLHKTAQETRDYFTVLKDSLGSVNLTDKEVIVCPSFTSLHAALQLVQEHQIPVSLGAQTISQFAEGAYTGEVSGTQVKEFADFVIIGHSERRRNFGETNEVVEQKVQRAKEAGLTVILCVQDENEPIVDGADIIAFEPVNAIGTGSPEDPERIKQVFEMLQNKTQAPLLYGGSVSPEAVGNFKNIPLLAGFLIGGASLDPESFTKIISS